MKLSDFLSGVGRPIAFYPGLVKAIGDRNEALFLCQMMYWRDKGESADGWIYKTSEEIEEETSLTYKEQTNVRKGLLEKGLLKEHYARTEHKMYFRVNWDAVNEKWEQFTDGHMPVGKMASSRRAGGSLPKVISLNSNTETTTETTTDIKRKPDFKSLKPSQYKTIPELKLFMDATGWIPGSFVLETVYDFIHAGLTLEQVAGAFTAWTARGYKPANVEGYLTWARDGVPHAYSQKSKKTDEQRPEYKPIQRNDAGSVPNPYAKPAAIIKQLTDAFTGGEKVEA